MYCIDDHIEQALNARQYYTVEILKEAKDLLKFPIGDFPFVNKLRLKAKIGNLHSLMVEHNSSEYLALWSERVTYESILALIEKDYHSES